MWILNIIFIIKKINLINSMGLATLNIHDHKYYLVKQIEKEIASITADPKSAYWDKNHPNHAAAVQEVLELREKKPVE